MGVLEQKLTQSEALWHGAISHCWQRESLSIRVPTSSSQTYVEPSQLQSAGRQLVQLSQRCSGGQSMLALGSHCSPAAGLKNASPQAAQSSEQFPIFSPKSGSHAPLKLHGG